MIDWRPESLRCERLVGSVVVGRADPLLSWRLADSCGDDPQSAYQLRFGHDLETLVTSGDFWDTGWVESLETRARYPGPPLQSRQRIFWMVRVRTANAESSAWSEPAGFEVGLLRRSDWTASWISHSRKAPRLPARAAYLLRRNFQLDAEAIRATIYASALGVYMLAVNGVPVGDGLLRPGWTDHRRRVQYQAIDVTAQLQPGENAIAAVLAPGWYAGRISSQASAESAEAVPAPELIAQLEIEYEEGSPRTVGTDELWQWAPSAISSSDLYDGEDWDRRLWQGGWSELEGVGVWEPVEVSNGTAGALVAERCEPLRVTAVTPAEVTWLADGSALIDSGRNDTGYLRLRVDEARGRRVEVSYGELLDPSGNLYRDNLRGARCTDSFICAGEGTEELSPAFSYRGYRFAQVRGLSGPSHLHSTEAVRLGTDMVRTGWFTSSEPLLEQIYELMVCSLQANYVEVPTDCPQRDERMGWLADALLFAPIAAYTYDISAFMAKWFDDVLDARTPAGGFPDVAPRPSALWPGRSFLAGAPAWADAGILLPWLIYERYGDTEVLESMFPAMRQHLELIHRENPDGIWRRLRGNDYGDWVPAGPDTSHDLFSTCWLYRSTVVGSQIAEILKDSDSARWLIGRARAVRAAFLERYVDPATGMVFDASATGSAMAAHHAPKVAPETQTGYVVALAHGLLEGDLAAKAGQRLADLVVQAGRRLETGFCGSAFLPAILDQAGHAGLAYDLLLRREPPSLGFMVDMGATSVWERWDGLDEARWPACPTMNSFNHYAMSSMLSWLIEGVCGLRPVPGVSGLRQIRFAPALSRRLGQAGFRFDAPAGRLELAWAWAGDGPGGQNDTVVGSIHLPAGMRCSIAATVALDDDPKGASIGPSSEPASDQVVGAGDHRVIWRVPAGANGR